MKLSKSPSSCLETLSAAELEVFSVSSASSSSSSCCCCCCWILFFFFLLLIEPNRALAGLVCTSSSPKVMEGEAVGPFWTFVGLLTELGRWITGPCRFENTFKLNKNKGERTNCLAKNSLIQSPHVRVNLDINEGRLKTKGRFGKLKTRTLNQGFPHEILHVCCDELPGCLLVVKRVWSNW